MLMWISSRRHTRLSKSAGPNQANGMGRMEGKAGDHEQITTVPFVSKKTMKTVMAELDQFGGDQGGGSWTDAYSYTSCSRSWHRRRRFARPLSWQYTCTAMIEIRKWDLQNNKGNLLDCFLRSPFLFLNESSKLWNFVLGCATMRYHPFPSVAAFPLTSYCFNDPCVVLPRIKIKSNFPFFLQKSKKEMKGIFGFSLIFT